MFLVIGTVTADLLVKSERAPNLSGEDGFRSSNLVFTDAPLTISMGGNGGNSAYVLAGLGAPTALAGAVGQDLLGDALVGWLAARGVNLDGLHRSAGHATSTSTIILTGAESQVVYHHLGSSAQAGDETIPASLLDATDVLLASSFPILPRYRAGGFARVLSRVKRRGGVTALDIGPAIGAPVTLDELRPLFPHLDYLIANSHELCALTGAARWENGAAELLQADVNFLVIKQGADGAALWSAREMLHAPAFPVTTDVSVGAGDAFNVGFLYALHRGRVDVDALLFANAVAALVIGNPQGILGAPTLAEVEALVGGKATQAA